MVAFLGVRTGAGRRGDRQRDGRTAARALGAVQPAGLSLAARPVVRRSGVRFVPRPAAPTGLSPPTSSTDRQTVTATPIRRRRGCRRYRRAQFGPPALPASVR